MSSEKTTVLTKDTITRLLRDVKGIMKNPLTENGIYYIPVSYTHLRAHET